MGKRKEHDEIVKGLRKSFPKLTEFELAELSLKSAPLNQCDDSVHMTTRNFG